MINLKQGDAFKLIKEIPDNNIDLVLTDPPYDKAEEYMERLTDMQKREMAKQFKRVLKSTGNIALFCGYVDQYTWHKVLTEEELKYKRTLIWVYKNPSHGKLRIMQQAKTFIMAHEAILLFSKTENSYFNNEGVVPVSWFEHPAYSGFRRSAEGNPQEKLGVTPKPLKIARTLINRLCPPKGTVLDPFAGYGTFGIASMQLDRNYIGYEIRPEICEIAWERIAKFKSRKITEWCE